MPERGSQPLVTNEEWRDFGRRDPMYGVLTLPGKAAGTANAWTEQDFYASGEADWAEFWRTWRSYGVDPATCLEIGCGAGRLTRAMARSFASVIALDVSPNMLEMARRNCEGDVRFVVGDGASLPLSDGSVEAVFSVLVFQHFGRVEDGLRNFAEAFRVLGPGGSLMVQLPVYAWPARATGYGVLYRLRRVASVGRAELRRLLLRRGVGRPFHRYVRYELGWLQEQLPRLGFSGLEFRTFKPTVHPEWLTFVLARKP